MISIDIRSNTGYIVIGKAAQFAGEHKGNIRNARDVFSECKHRFDEDFARNLGVLIHLFRDAALYALKQKLCTSDNDQVSVGEFEALPVLRARHSDQIFGGNRGTRAH